MSDYTGVAYPSGLVLGAADSGFGTAYSFGGGGTPAVNYVQRVYSSGLAVWCYYTKTSVDPTPASGETTPNWTGSITAHQVLATT